MTPLRRARRRRPPLPAAALAATLAGAIGVVAGLPGTAGAIGEEQVRDGRSPYDQRAAAVSAGAASVTPSTAARALARQLGPEGIVELDPISGTPRRVLRTDGALTGPSDDAPAEIVLRYVREHRAVFRLDDAAIAALGSPEVNVSPAGVRHLRWTQRHEGVPVLGAGLRAHVAADGRLLAIQGGALPDTAVASATPRLGAASALGRVRRDAGTAGAVPSVAGASGGPSRRTTFDDGSRADLVVFAAAGGNRLAWSVRAALDSTHVYAYVVDATSGAVLKRSNMVRFASGHGRAWSYTPSVGPVPSVSFEDGWVTTSDALRGDYAHVYPDVLDRYAPWDAVAPADEIGSTGADPGDGRPRWDFPFTPITRTGPPAPFGWNCSVLFPCTWSSFDGQLGSWEANKRQNAVQVFWFINTFRRHLASDPIGFDAASGAFEVATPGGTDGDPVIGQSNDGAATGGANPDPSHLNNANMYTPPNGESPVMQMYLFTAPLDRPDDPTIDGNGGDDAAIVYHEYTHGLSNRLVTDGGIGALTLPQAGAMGEAWSDWYALDFLVGEGHQADTSAPGEIVLAGYLTQGQNWLRAAALDCPVDVLNAPRCPSGGGFTYGDYGKIWYGPEVHADGEIWAQTLWDLRAALIEAHGEANGIRAARMLVTEAMRTSPPEPSFLEMRDQILLADQTRAAGVDHDLIWGVFAKRGMGYYADTHDAYDPAPIEDFSPPPTEAPTARVSGTVTDADTGAPLGGVRVWLPGPAGPTTTSGDDGRYVLTSVVPTGYPRLLAARSGYDDLASPTIDVAADGSSVRDVALRRNWALYSGGTTVAQVAVPDLGSTCGPGGGIDGTLAYGWGSYAQGFTGDPGRGLPPAPTGPRELVLRLPQAVDVTSFAIDPGAVCGDDDSASLGQFTIETSSDGAAWRPSVAHTFTRQADPNHRMNALTPGAASTGGVRYVRVTMIRPQGGPGSSDEEFMDMAELAIYGSAVRPTGPPDPPLPPDPGPPAQPRQPDPTPPANPAPPTVPAPPVRPSARDGRGPTLAGVRLQPARGGLRALTGRGLKLTLRCSDEPCRVGATVTLPAATARTLGLTRRRGGAPFVLARASGRGFVAANRPATLTLRVSRAVARRLARTTRLTPSIAVTATDAAGNATPTKLKPRLRR